MRLHSKAFSPGTPYRIDNGREELCRNLKGITAGSICAHPCSYICNANNRKERHGLNELQFISSFF